MSPFNQPFRKFTIVVNLSIENDPDILRLIANGLMPGVKVNNTQAPHPNSDRPRDKYAVIVRSAMHHRVAHGLDDSWVDNFTTVRIDITGNTAH